MAFGKGLGIRIVPEFDVVGHSQCFEPLAWDANGVKFCSNASGPNLCRGTDDCMQLWDDPGGVTYKTLRALFGEMAGLFPDHVLNIGADETRASGRCTVNSSVSIERRLVTAIQSELNKTPAGWEGGTFDRAATPQTIVSAWATKTAVQVAATGRRAIECASGHFYLTDAAPGGPAGWKKCWWDIGGGQTPPANRLLLGGEISMWTTTYCYCTDCMNFDSTCAGSTRTPGWQLFSRQHDDAFRRSIGGMIWPRGLVAAGAFWNSKLVRSSNSSSPAFASSIYKLNDALAARNLSTCPSHCSCNQTHACDRPFLPSVPVQHAPTKCPPSAGPHIWHDFTPTGGPFLPTWPATYDMGASTIMMPSRTAGLMPMGELKGWGIIDIDGGNAQAQWSKATPMNCSEMMDAQAALIKRAYPAAHVFVYRNAINALPWITAVREKLESPDHAAWFLPFASSPCSTCPHVPNCSGSPTKCSSLYHDSTPSAGDYAAGDCGSVPCGNYVFDMRAANLTVHGQSMLDWYVDEYVLGSNGTGHPAIAVR